MIGPINPKLSAKEKQAIITAKSQESIRLQGLLKAYTEHPNYKAKSKTEKGYMVVKDALVEGERLRRMLYYDDSLVLLNKAIEVAKDSIRDGE